MSVEQELHAYIASELAGQDVELKRDSNLEGVVDSAAVMELVVWMESKFGVEVDIVDITPDNFGSIAKLSAYIEGKKSA